MAREFFPLLEGIMVGFDDEPESQGRLVSWGLWEAPEAANDESIDEPPTAA
jgi:hypothetical protein